MDETNDWLAEAHRVAQGIRRRVLRYVIEENGGYLSQACSSAEMLATLYTHVLRLGPSQGPPIPEPFRGVPGPGGAGSPNGALYNGPRGPHLDRFFFSPVHYALVLYAALIETGRMAPEGLAQFNRDGSTVEMIGAEHSPGHEVTGGSLAQTFSVALGVALARKRRGDTGRVWVFLSDGELQEGQTWETLSAARFHELGNLSVLIDANGCQCDGEMNDVGLVEPMAERLRAFGAHVHELDGHAPQAIADAAADTAPDRPTVLIGRSNPSCGIDVLAERKPRFHYVRFKSDDERDAYRAALAEMDRAATFDPQPAPHGSQEIR